MDKPFSQACQNNQDPILEKIAPLLRAPGTVLEIGSGTGQHGAYFARQLPWLHWQYSDRPENLPGIRLWQQEAGLDNLPPPIVLDVLGPWPEQSFDAIYSANTCHIMAWPMVEALFQGVERQLQAGGLLLIYGPFNYDGQFTSPSNAQFDAQLRQSDPQQGIRDQESINALAEAAGLALIEDFAMPANNRLLVWRKSEH